MTMQSNQFTLQNVLKVGTTQPGFKHGIEETAFDKKISTFAEPCPRPFVTIEGPLIIVEARQGIKIQLPGQIVYVAEAVREHLKIGFSFRASPVRFVIH